MLWLIIAGIVLALPLVAVIAFKVWWRIAESRENDEEEWREYRTGRLFD